MKRHAAFPLAVIVACVSLAAFAVPPERRLLFLGGLLLGVGLAALRLRLKRRAQPAPPRRRR